MLDRLSLSSGDDAAALVARYYAYRLFRAMAFTVPVYVLFFQRRGLSLAEFGVLEAVYTVVLVVAEFPTGYVADRIGRRNSLLAAATLGALGALVYMLAHSFAVFLAGAVLRAVAGTFASGAGDAWLYDVLDADAQSDRFADVAGRASALGKVGHATAAVCGAVAYAHDPLLPWVFDVAAAWCAAAILVTVPASLADAEDADEDSRSVRDAVAVAHQTLARPQLRPVVAYTAVLFGVLTVASLFVQPVSVDLVGLDPALLGGLYATLTLAGAGGAALTGRIEATMGVRRWFLLAPIAVGALAVATGLLPPLTLALFVLVDVVAAASHPLASAYCNDRTDATYRASVLSGYALVRSVARVPLKLAAGALASAALGLLLPVLGAFVVLGCLVVWLLARPFASAGDADASTGADATTG
jgi:MFS family permease